MTWGDVLCAAIDACAAGGTDREVDPKDLPDMIPKILEVRGDARSTYDKKEGSD